MSRKKIYLGKDNRIKWHLQEGGSAVDLTGITKFVVEVAGETIEVTSAEKVEFGPIYWTTGTPETDVANLFLNLGEPLETAEVTAGYYDLRLIAYDADHDDGFVWCQEPVQIIA